MGKFLDLTRKRSEEFELKSETTPKTKKLPVNSVNIRSENFYYLIIGILFLVLIYSLFFFLKNQTDTSNSSQTNYIVTPAPTPQEITPTATSSQSNSNFADNDTLLGNVLGVQSPSIDKSSISIKILNGSGKNGLAAQAKQDLEKKGFKIESIGNAKNSYNSTIIYYNKNKKEEAQIVSDNLTQFQTSLQENPELTGQYDILIVLGTK